MMKPTLLFFAGLIFSCSSSKYENSLDQLNLEGSVKSLKSLNYIDETMMFGELTPVNYDSGEILNFDINGNMIQNHYFESIGDYIKPGNWDSNLNFINVHNLKQYIVGKFKTNKNGHISRRDIYLSDGTLMYIEKYEYDSKAKLISIKSYWEDGKLRNNQIYNYENNNGCSIFKTEANGDGRLSKKTRCVKYKNGVKIVEDENGNIIKEYNEKGDLTKKVLNEGVQNYFYLDFDEQGNWLKRYFEFKEESFTYKEFEIRFIEYY